MVASSIRFRRSRCASEPSSESLSTDTGITSRGCAPVADVDDRFGDGFGVGDDIADTAPFRVIGSAELRLDA